MTDNARARAARNVAAVVFERRSLRQMSGADNASALAHQLALGTLRSGLRYQAILKQMLKQPQHAQDPLIVALLMIGLYQLEHMRKPDYVTLNETVEACLALRRARARGLVNAVLRGYLDLQRRETLQKKLTEHEHASLPPWLFKRLKRRWPRQLPDIVEAFGAEPKLCLRVNRRHLQRERYSERLREADIAHQNCVHCEHGVLLERNCPIAKLPGYEEGWFSVQDQSAQLAAPLLEAPVGARTLDACAAPGGKSAHILELTEPSALVAIDTDARRLRRLRNNLDRLQLNSPALHVVEADAADVDSWWDGEPFDRILLDAPCSATGVLRRHPDIAFTRRENDLKSLARQQSTLLEALWGCLRRGGRLLYVSCSLLAEENESRVEDFLAAQPQAKALPMDEIPWGEPCGIGRITLPSVEGGDGLFFACLQRAS